MKKNLKFILLFIINLFSTAILFSQSNYQGSINVTGYYGFPNFAKSSLADNGFIPNSAPIRGINPCGIRAEYLATDKIGVGFDFIYNSAQQKLTASQINYVYNAVTQLYDSVSIETTEERSMQRIRFMARINFHFDTSNPNFDPYFGIGLGTNNRYRKYWVDGVLQQSTPSSNGIYSSSIVLPISMRLCLGMRYSFNQRIALNLELGLVGPLMSAGLSFKLK